MYSFNCTLSVILFLFLRICTLTILHFLVLVLLIKALACSLRDPRNKLGNFGEDSGLLRACAGAERNDTDDVEATSTVAAYQRTTRITLMLEMNELSN